MAALWPRKLKLRTFHAGAILAFFTSYFFTTSRAFGICRVSVDGARFDRKTTKMPECGSTRLLGDGPKENGAR